jgi:hypothetical protein
MSKIKVDIDEMIERLQEMKEDDYVTAELEIIADSYDCELKLSAVSFDSEEPIDYGTVAETLDELM